MIVALDWSRWSRRTLGMSKMAHTGINDCPASTLPAASPGREDDLLPDFVGVMQQKLAQVHSRPS